jgi:putative membrane protein PagO
MSEKFRVYLAYFFVCSIWGSTWLFIKIGLESLTPLFAAGLRFLFASSIIFLLMKVRRIAVPNTSQARRLFAAITVASFAVPFALVYWGEQFIPSGLASILFSLYPFAVALFSFILLRSERIMKSQIAGIIIGFLGIVIIFGNDVKTSSSYALMGMGAVVVSATLQAFSLVNIRKRGEGIHPFALTAVPMAFSSILLLIASFVFEDLTKNKFTMQSVFSIFYLGFFGSVFTFVSYFWLVKRVRPVFLSLTSFITPIIAVLLGITVLGEQFSIQILLGAVVVLVGILVANSGELGKMALARMRISEP